MADEHASVAEVLTTAQQAAHEQASIAEVLWEDLTFTADIDASVAEVLWGTPGAPAAQYAAEYGSVAEVLFEPPQVGHELASVAEVLAKFDVAVADVLDIRGKPLVPATFDGSTSLGAITHYRWAWVSVPPGSALANVALPYPDAQAPVPIDMTNNEVLFHCEEVAPAIIGIDTSGNGNHAFLTSITVGSPGLVGNYAWNYGAANSVADLGPGVSLATDWTIAFWFQGLAPNTAYRTGIRGKTNHHPIMVNNGTDELGAYENGANVFHGCGFQMSVAEYAGWHHMVARGASNGIDFYVDGAFVGSISGFRPSDVDGLYAIGNLQGSLGGNQRFADRIDEFAMWSRPLSATEIADIFVLQRGLYTGAGISHTFTPDVEGTYTIALQVISAATGLPDEDLADAVIKLSGAFVQFPVQGDALRMWGHLQGQPLRRRGQK